MCGRYSLDYNPEFDGRFSVSTPLEPRYNIAPGEQVPVIRQDQAHSFLLMRWGLIPHWAKDEKGGYKMINALAETLRGKPAFRSLLRSRRCLLPASGFYEWQETEGKGKQPYHIHADNNEWLAFTGLYDMWRSPEGTDVYSCTIITTEATAALKPLHDRMPAILEPAAEDMWLSPLVTDPQQILPLLKPYTFRPLVADKVSKAVNKAGYDSRDLIVKVNES
jgi:putative SOS response-associated peptidase YedK